MNNQGFGPLALLLLPFLPLALFLEWRSCCDLYAEVEARQPEADAAEILHNGGGWIAAEWGIQAPQAAQAGRTDETGADTQASPGIAIQEG